MYDKGVPYPALPKNKRLTAAQVSGLVSRLVTGRDRELPLPEKLDRIWALTRDPEILGHELGPYLAEENPHAGTECARILLWVAGADRQVAEVNAAWQRERRIWEAGGGPRM